MAEAASAGVTEVPVPEPELTPEEVVGRAQALIPKIREQQDEAERLGHHTASLDQEFMEAGFYRILPATPLRRLRVRPAGVLEDHDRGLNRRSLQHAPNLAPRWSHVAP